MPSSTTESWRGGRHEPSWKLRGKYPKRGGNTCMSLDIVMPWLGSGEKVGVFSHQRKRMAPICRIHLRQMKKQWHRWSEYPNTFLKEKVTEQVSCPFASVSYLTSVSSKPSNGTITISQPTLLYTTKTTLPLSGLFGILTAVDSANRNCRDLLGIPCLIEYRGLKVWQFMPFTFLELRLANWQWLAITLACWSRAN